MIIWRNWKRVVTLLEKGKIPTLSYFNSTACRYCQTENATTGAYPLSPKTPCEGSVHRCAGGHYKNVLYYIYGLHNYTQTDALHSAKIIAEICQNDHRED